MFAYEPDDVVIIAHSPLVNAASGSSLRPLYVKRPFFAQSPRFWMCFTCTGPLNSSRVPRPPKPFCSVANGTLCQALKLSSCTHDCQPVVNAHGAPEAFSFSIAGSISSHVFGGLFGSSPAFLKAASLT